MNSKEKAEKLVEAVNQILTLKLDYGEGEVRRVAVNAIAQIAQELAKEKYEPPAGKDLPAPSEPKIVALPKKRGRKPKALVNGAATGEVATGSN